MLADTLIHTQSNMLINIHATSQAGINGKNQIRLMISTKSPLVKQEMRLVEAYVTMRVTNVLADLVISAFKEKPGREMGIEGGG